MSAGSVADGRIIETKIPARLDRLPWARWHRMVLIGLGTSGSSMASTSRSSARSPRG